MEGRINASLTEFAIAAEGTDHKNSKSSSGSAMAGRKPRPARRPQDATTQALCTTYPGQGGLPMKYPFYNYINYSNEADADPQTPLTAIGRVPTFPAKLHAILLRSDTDFKSVVTWQSHGRSWKVLNSTEFEERVIPMYFEFTKHQYSSFFRQAKLWGFRRIKREGPDLDSYYNPRFLRGLPHLCKNLKRPTKLPEEHVNMEPDLAVISETYPVPDNKVTTDPTINLSWFLNGRSDAEAYITAATAHATPNPSALQSRKRSHDDAKNTAPSQYHPPVLVPLPVSYPDTDSYMEEEMLHDDMGLKLDCFFSNNFDLYPFYDYEDCSREEDIDPWMPVTAVGHNPSFPAKLHSILIRSDLSHIVAWLPHGRSWKIVDARAFETIVIPMYFDFSYQLYSSFVYEMKCWGFKRFPGEDDSYYHPRFLRGLPHLCKNWICESSIPIPEDSEPDEPDFDKISELFPLPDFRLTSEDASSLHWYLLGRSV